MPVVGTTKLKMIVLLVVLGIALIVGLVLGLRGCECESTTADTVTATTAESPTTTIAATTTELVTTTTTKPAATHRRATTTIVVQITSTTVGHPFAGTHSGHYYLDDESTGTVVFVVSSDGSVVGSGAGDLVFTVFGTVTPQGVLGAGGTVNYHGLPTPISFSGNLPEGDGYAGGGVLVGAETPVPGMWGVPDLG